jgi:hypothetical protein
MPDAATASLVRPQDLLERALFRDLRRWARLHTDVPLVEHAPGGLCVTVRDRLRTPAGLAVAADLRHRALRFDCRLDAATREPLYWFADVLAEDSRPALPPARALALAEDAAPPPPGARLAEAGYERTGGGTEFVACWAHEHEGCPVEGDFLDVRVNGTYGWVFSVARAWREPSFAARALGEPAPRDELAGEAIALCARHLRGWLADPARPALVRAEVSWRPHLLRHVLDAGVDVWREARGVELRLAGDGKLVGFRSPARLPAPQAAAPAMWPEGAILAAARATGLLYRAARVERAWTLRGAIVADLDDGAPERPRTIRAVLDPTTRLLAAFDVLTDAAPAPPRSPPPPPPGPSRPPERA